MQIRRLRNVDEFIAGDGTRLREILHPDREYLFSGRYSLAHAVVNPGDRSARHRLKTDEVYYIISGSGIMHVGEESAEVSAGDTIDIPPGSIQWIANKGDDDLEFLCIVDPAWRVDDEEILE